MKIKSLTLCALFVTLITVAAFIKIPVPPLPFTLQLPIVILAGILLKEKDGFVCSCIYLLLGLMGLPVFSSGGGISYVLQPTFGFILGFPFAACAVGKLSHRLKEPGFKRLFLAGLSGVLTVYITGFAYYLFISRFYLGEGLDFKALFLNLCMLTLPKDIILCALSAGLGKRLLPIIG